MTGRIADRREEWDGPVPVPNGATVPFWEGTLEGELRYQDCECGHRQLYPRAVCTACGAEDPPFAESEGVGTIYTYTVCHVPGEPGFADRTPYVVGAIDLVAGPRLLALLDAEPGALEIGAAVGVTFWRISDEAAIPVFVPEY